MTSGRAWTVDHLNGSRTSKGHSLSFLPRRFLELLRHLGQSLMHNVNLPKPKLAERVVVALEARPDWETASLGNMHFAYSVWDAADASTIAFCLELSMETWIRLFFPATRVAAPPAVEGLPPSADADVPGPPQPPMTDFGTSTGHYHWVGSRHYFFDRGYAGPGRQTESDGEQV